MTTQFDRRRIPAPEESRPPVYATAESEAGPSKRDRPADALRPIFLKTGLVTQANGSAYIEAAGVKIACSWNNVSDSAISFGPRPRPPPYTPHGTLNLEVKFAPFASRARRAPLRDTEPVNHTALLTQLLLPALRLHLLPKLSVDVHILVLEADSDAAVLSAGLTAACAAVTDAGIPINGLAVGSVVSTDGQTLLLDPTGDETSTAQCTVTLGAMPALGKVTSLHLVGEVDLDQACEMIELTLTGAKATHNVAAQSILDGAS
ncbi:uncharacterized protein EHS24_009497 [Apiotrichum porosum]|uniref:Uncharacterized protein n=1 Tax=Apiotrichum porosum TaxID=105984 RepID=A0A427XM99_9TREE|nr:uncharacterized protein EHS24_009497 [Apiotrichum porosum]RSH79837.1 hypothetical protein EHS24_009497 [Apiotrichum porosum]